jgi:transposase-like protein
MTEPQKIIIRVKAKEPEPKVYAIFKHKEPINELKKPVIVTPGEVQRIYNLTNPPMAQLAQQHFTEIPITCKWCGANDIKKYGTRKDVQEYICLKCGRKFIDKDAPFKKQTDIELIGTSISSYFDGLSFADIARRLSESGNPVNESTVYRWVMSYSQKAVKAFDNYHPQTSDIWTADETAIKFQKDLYWIWDIIDTRSRFLLASYLSPNRGTAQARILMEAALKRAGGIPPKKVATDKLAAYLDGIEMTFGSETRHIQSSPFEMDNDNNFIERMQGTIKDRTKVIRGFKHVETARIIIDGFLIHYNYFKPHMGLKDLPPKGIDKTPADVAKIKIPFKTWTDFVRSDK